MNTHFTPMPVLNTISILLRPNVYQLVTKLEQFNNYIKHGYYSIKYFYISVTYTNQIIIIIYHDKETIFQFVTSYND